MFNCGCIGSGDKAYGRHGYVGKIEKWYVANGGVSDGKNACRKIDAKSKLPLDCEYSVCRITKKKLRNGDLFLCYSFFCLKSSTFASDLFETVHKPQWWNW